MTRTILLVAFLVLPFIASAADPTPSEQERICRGAIATLFSPPIEAVRVTKKEEGVIYLSYQRKSDGSEWSYKCRIEGSAVVWGAADGRWRTNPKDEKISFRIDRAKGTFTIRQAFEDGSGNDKTFPLVEKRG